MLNYFNFTLEHKLWGKTIAEFLSWIDYKSNNYWIWIDTETTGLPSDKYEVQLVQISCIVTKYDFVSNKIEQVDVYNKKIKLNTNTKNLIKKADTRIKSVLSFNHYGQRDVKYYDESDTLDDFKSFIDKYKNSILIIQNAEFDMKYLNTSGYLKIKNEVIDTKQIIQLFYLPCLLKLSETDESIKKIVNKIGTSDRDNGLISSSMSKIGPALGLDMSRYHNALDDCAIMQQMFLTIIDFLKRNQEVDISKYQSDRIAKKRLNEKVNIGSPLLDLIDNVDMELMKIIKNMIPIGSSILEISCGNSADAEYLLNSGYKITCTETNQDYINNALDKGINCINHDTRDKFPFPSKKFELIYSRFGLHYFSIEDLDSILNELNRIGNKILITVKLVDDIKTHKVILNQKLWKSIIGKYFTIEIFQEKEGVIYGSHSKWLQIIATAK